MMSPARCAPRVTPLWVTAAYTPSAPGSHPTMDRPSAGIGRTHTRYPVIAAFRARLPRPGPGSATRRPSGADPARTCAGPRRHPVPPGEPAPRGGAAGAPGECASSGPGPVRSPGPPGRRALAPRRPAPPMGPAGPGMPPRPARPAGEPGCPRSTPPVRADLLAGGGPDQPDTVAGPPGGPETGHPARLAGHHRDSLLNGASTRWLTIAAVNRYPSPGNHAMAGAGEGSRSDGSSARASAGSISRAGYPHWSACPPGRRAPRGAPG